jgi:hypothetical protein
MPGAAAVCATASRRSAGASPNWRNDLRKKTPAEMERAKIAKAARTLIRLKHSLRADEEINAVLPDKLEEFDEALSRGEIRELKAGLDDVLGGDDAAGA